MDTVYLVRVTLLLTKSNEMGAKKNILITGGTGVIGTHLVALLTQQGYGCHILTRNPSQDNHFAWDLKKKTIDLACFKDVDCIIHLAGAGIAEKRWTPARKKEIIESRVKGPELLFSTMQENSIKVRKVISASGINYYDFKSDQEIKVETDKNGSDFINECVSLWEASIKVFAKSCQVVMLRTGVVLTRGEGALNKIEKPIKYFVGAPLGSGKQWVPWIHIDDVCKAYLMAIEQPIEGVFNLIADEHISNKTLTKAIAKKINRWVLPIGVPSFLLKWMLGEMADLVLSGYRASNEKLKSEGFKCEYPSLNEALGQIYRG